MRSTFLLIGLAAALSLSACSGMSTSPLEEALASEAVGDDGTVANVFIDVRGIQETVGREPVDLTGRLDPAAWDEADRWSLGLLLEQMLPSPDGRGPAIPTSNIEWTYAGLRGWAVRAPQETIDATLELWAAQDLEGYVRVADQTMLIQTGAAPWETGFEESMLDAPLVQALLPCLEGAHVLSILGSDEPSGFYEHSFATAASVDEDAQGRAWSCVHVPDGADDFAANIEPDGVGEVTVDGDVVRVEMVVTAGGEGRLPTAAQHALSAVVTMSPGF